MAYDRLVAEGFSRPGPAPAPSSPRSAARPPTDARRARPGPSRRVALWDDRAATAPRPVRRRLRLLGRVPDASLFPLATWRRLVSATMRRGRLSAGTYDAPGPGAAGSRLEAEIARYAGRSRPSSPQVATSSPRPARSRRSTSSAGCSSSRVTSSPSRTPATRRGRGSSRRTARRPRRAGRRRGARRRRPARRPPASSTSRRRTSSRPASPCPCRRIALLEWAGPARCRHRRGRLRQRVPLRRPAARAVAEPRP